MGLDVADLCYYFHHVSECPECETHESCLCCYKTCTRKSVCCIADLVGDSRSFHAIYKNRRSKEKTLHAEQILTRCESLRAAISDCTQSRLTLYLTFQPCHYSGGRPGTDNHTSCTLALVKFKEFADCFRCKIVLKVANLYRVHWSCEPERSLYADKISNAVSGLGLLINHFDIDMFDARDWKYVEEMYGCTNLRYDPSHIAARRRICEYFSTEMEKIKNMRVGPGSSHARWGRDTTTNVPALDYGNSRFTDATCCKSPTACVRRQNVCWECVVEEWCS